MSKDLIKEYEGVLHRTYSFIDLLNLVQIQNIVRRGQEFSTIPDIPDQTILSVYDGKTIFSIFKDSEKVFDQLYDQIKSRTFDDSFDAFKKPTENVFLRRLHRIMSIPTEVLDIKDEDVGRDSDIKVTLSMNSIHEDSTYLRDRLIRMRMFCKEFDIGQMAFDIDDMSKLFTKYTPVLGKAFQDHCFVYNKSCEAIDNIDVYKSDADVEKNFAILSHTSSVNEALIQTKLYEEQDGLIGKRWA